MTATTVATANVEERWARKYFQEYIRDNRFKRYMGTDENAVIQLVEDLSKARGDKVTISLLTRLSGAGVTGDSALEGNEEALNNYGHQITVNQRRNAVRVNGMEKQKTRLPLLNAARAALMMWSKEQLRDDVIAALYSPALDGTAYASATETQKDAWLEANQDRVLFGELAGNLDTAGGLTGGCDHSDSLATIDNTNDKLKAASVSLAKRIAKTADPHIRPIRTTEDEEVYIMFAGSLGFRDLKEDLSTKHQNAMMRGKGNPLWRDGDLMYDGVIIREVPEIGVLSGVGAGSIDCGAAFLCGAQAVGVAFAQRPKPVFDEFDYGNGQGVGVSEILGVDKLIYNDKQHGLVTVYHAAVADA